MSICSAAGLSTACTLLVGSLDESVKEQAAGSIEGEYFPFMCHDGHLAYASLDSGGGALIVAMAQSPQVSTIAAQSSGAEHTIILIHGFCKRRADSLVFSGLQGLECKCRPGGKAGRLPLVYDLLMFQLIYNLRHGFHHHKIDDARVNCRSTSSLPRDLCAVKTTFGASACIQQCSPAPPCAVLFEVA